LFIFNQDVLALRRSCFI